MSTIIRSIAFKNFYNYYGDYEIKYDFKEGLNIVNADNGMGKSKLYNGLLWILKDEVYDSDSKSTKNILSSPLKILSDKAKLERHSLDAGVKIVFDHKNIRYTVEKSINFTKKHKDASTSDANDWHIADPRVDVSKQDLSTQNTSIVYDAATQNDIVHNMLISPSMQSYALLQGEAIDNIVDLSNSNRLASTIETLTDISELKSIEKSCLTFANRAKTDLQSRQEASTTNTERFDQLQKRKAVAEKEIEKAETSLENYKNELQLATERAEELESQVSNTSKRVEYQERCKHIKIALESATKELGGMLSSINDNLFKKGQPWLLLKTSGCIDRFIKIRDEYTRSRIEKQVLGNPHKLYSSLLPEGSPDDVSLDQMLIKHKCFVCGRDAAEGGDAWKHIEIIRNRSRIKPDATESDLHKFFDNIQTSVAPYMRVDDIFASIATEMEKIAKIRQQIQQLKHDLDNARNELFNYGGDPNNLDGEANSNLLKAHGKAVDDINRNNGFIESSRVRISDLKTEIEALEKQMQNLGGSDIPEACIKMKDIMVDAQEIFTNTKKRIYDEVLSNLEIKANSFYGQLTAGNKVMGGQLKFNKTSYDSIQIKVLTDRGDELSGASEGFQRMKKIAVVMAIISSNVGGGHFNYPFIADAPFSAFGRNFINNFFDIVPAVFSQSIIMVKELYDKDDEARLTENGKAILEKMKSGEIKGTFYMNYIPTESDTTGLITKIECYKS